jgi:hypothetical protein
MRPAIKIILLSAALAAAPTVASAQTRAVEQSRFIGGTVGAITGALIGGPIGLIAGAAFGYMMGPPVRYGNAVANGKAAPRRHAKRKQQPQNAQYIQAYQQPAGQQVYGYPQQPGYLATPPGQQPYAPQRPAFDPQRNPLVPSPEAMGVGQPYAAAATPAQYPMSYAPAPQAGYPQQPVAYAPQAAAPGARYPQIQAAPVPLPR